MAGRPRPQIACTDRGEAGHLVGRLNLMEMHIAFAIEYRLEGPNVLVAHRQKKRDAAVAGGGYRGRVKRLVGHLPTIRFSFS